MTSTTIAPPARLDRPCGPQPRARESRWLTYLATTRTGQAYVASVLAENPSAPIVQESAVLTLTAAVKGALQLAAG